jgi:hypothetical protein
MGLSDDKAAKAAKAQRDKQAEEALARSKSGKTGKLLSFGGSGRDSTKPENQGLYKREIEALRAENDKSGHYGNHGGRAVSNRAREAQRRGRGR